LHSEATQKINQSGSLLQKVKQAVIGIIGRDNANRLANPFYDWAAQRRTRKRLLALPKSNLLVNLGCGPRGLKGWLNVDMARALHIDIVWNATHGLPFAAESCTAILNEHMIEHIAKEDAEKLLQECWRVLQPGGVLRISTPDAELYLRSYLGDGEFLNHPSFEQKADTRMDRINMMMREYGQHLWIYDAESLSRLLTKAGFASVVRQSFGISQHPAMQGIDYEIRAFESLYVEAVK